MNITKLDIKSPPSQVTLSKSITPVYLLPHHTPTILSTISTSLTKINSNLTL